ncbi:DUF1254 domain-containing protein [Cellulomonas sp. 179-A 4D5 NHS]|uniref:DUF1254 domain-containing protein n=1 Tax=Cellulomonas sp. 179-A 4D5 NHS TaxID=3142378 RepID=UPI0039A1C23A
MAGSAAGQLAAPDHAAAPGGAALGHVVLTGGGFMADGRLAELATTAYLYGFPLVFNLDQVQRYATTGIGSVPAAAYNTFGHARELAGPADTFVTINNDTVYSMAQIDLGVGPVLLTVPDTDDRYYVLQLVDAWTNNFAYVGKRATGTGAGRFLLVPPGWDGEQDGAATVIRFPTRVASIVGRWAVAGPDDLPAVHALQDATTLTPVGDPDAVAGGLPQTTSTGDEALDFWERYRAWSQAFPPAERDAALQESFAVLGLTTATTVGDLDDVARAVLVQGYAAGQAALGEALRSGPSPQVNGWHLTLHAFDYNLDFFEVGTLDDPRWKLTDPRVRIPERAAAAFGGLWGNHGYEAAYFMVYVDADGEQLDGANACTLRLSPTPPVGAFWSLTMYDVPSYFLVENPIGRYSVGDRTPGLITDPDGGVTIVMSHDRPDAPVNWLPAPAGPFRPILRMYTPGQDVIDGTYEVPAIHRAR